MADIARKTGYEEICFLDDNENLTECGGYPVVGTSSKWSRFDCDIFVAIGNSKIRERMMEELADKLVPILIHPNAVIGENVSIGLGTVVVAGAIINPGATIGKGCICTTVSLTMKTFVVETAKYLHEKDGYDITLICNEDEAFEKSLPDYLHFIPVHMARGIDTSALSSIKQFIKVFREREQIGCSQFVKNCEHEDISLFGTFWVLVLIILKISGKRKKVEWQSIWFTVMQ